MFNPNWATPQSNCILILRYKVTFVFLTFFAHSILDRLLFMDIIVFEIAIPIVILRNTEVIKLSANNC